MLHKTTVMVPEDLDLWEPLTSDVLLEVRTSKMKKMPGLEIESGIDKVVQHGPIKVSRFGLEDDEHDPTFHGGIDKAVHGYCSSHYPGWQSEFPEAANRFVPGGFGENLVMARMNERNVCIGDVFSVGNSVLLQVSLPRQPCFKLNHRFQLKNFAPRTKDSSRTGWYYRVLREGEIKAGDPIRLVERKWPKWTIERIQEYLHRDQNDGAMNEELAEIEALGEESRGAFRKRVAKAQAKAKRDALGVKREPWRDFRIVEKKKETDRVASLVLEAITPDPYPESPGKGGLHVRLLLPNGLERTYSVVSGGWNRFELGVALDPKSRGGSKWLHDVTPGEGALVKVGRMTTDVAVANAASNHVFIAGGIGITAFLSLIESYISMHFNVELHYGVRSAETDLPFQSRIDKLRSRPSSDGFTLYLYDASKGERMDTDKIVRDLTWNSQLYVCGPLKMMDAAQQAVRNHGLQDDEVHFEAFAAETGGDPFQAEVANRGGKVVRVGEDESLLEALKREFGNAEVESSCEVGNCGTCKIGVRDGRVDHRGTALSAAEKDNSMLSCVSRGIGRIVIEI